MNNFMIIIAAGLVLTAFTKMTSPDEQIKLKNIDTEEMMQPALIHTVYFWTKEETSKEQMKSFEKGLVTLGTCPQIAAYYWGPPAPTEARGVVDNSYQYAISVHFNTVADEKAYQTEPIHLAFIDAHNSIWEKVVVYDNLVK